MSECWNCSPEINPTPAPPGPLPEIHTPEISLSVPILDQLPHTGLDFLIIGITAAALILAGVLLVYGVRWLYHLEDKR